MNFPPPEFSRPHPFPVVPDPLPRPELFMYLDVTLLGLGLALAAWLTLRKRSRFGVVALMLASIAYFGFWRRGCVCAIGSIQNVALALADRNYALPMVAGIFFLLPLLFALFFGRVFCAAVCTIWGSSSMGFSSLVVSELLAADCSTGRRSPIGPWPRRDRKAGSDRATHAAGLCQPSAR